MREVESTARTWTTQAPRLRGRPGLAAALVCRGPQGWEPCHGPGKLAAMDPPRPHRRGLPSSRKVLSPSSQDLERSVVMASR